ncbi:uncharacterized protein YbjT (DUF2867 family) [Kribbella aluminosa]|uniref:Uncharacterized protein YbjT (DUF2867 family) n=1 Tax=Kribbella aluminosa TaxID=416017 RepID=A0ABS4UT70_9ACTN|nr:hypothetical protein [Kribbella aluminosa]MBP2354833.1 uncharacterized protein YbjT (DUF2867 family) [Kribbella aluminosa]
MDTFLILGGTGTTGRRIADRLRAGGHDVRTAARTGADVRLDLDDPTTWHLDGIAAAYLMEPTIRPGGRLARFTEAALAAGVRRLVLLSASRASDAGHPLHTAEQAVRDADEWTILHPNWFAQNFSEGPWRAAVRTGRLALPAGNGRTAFVDADDIADVAVAALTTSGHHGRTYELTGPEAITFAEAAAHLEDAGHRVEYVAIDSATYVEEQVAQGVPRSGAELLAAILGGLDGRPTTDLQRALDRPARSFRTFVRNADWG